MDLHARGVATDQLCVTIASHADLTLLLDLDGTLIPFAARVEDANLDVGAVRLLGALHDAGIHVVIVSGRPHALLAPLRLLAPHAWWVAEHGTWRCDDTRHWKGTSAAPEIAELTSLLEVFARVPGAHIESKSLSACLHWRMVPQELKAEMIRGAELVCDEWLESHAEFERIRLLGEPHQILQRDEADQALARIEHRKYLLAAGVLHHLEQLGGDLARLERGVAAGVELEAGDRDPVDRVGGRLLGMELDAVLLEQRFIDRSRAQLSCNAVGHHVGDHQRSRQAVATCHLQDDQDRRDRRPDIHSGS